MGTLAFAIPLTPGKSDEWIQWDHEMAGPRREEYLASRRRLGITGEQGFLQRTPHGDFAIIVLESDDFERMFREIATSQEPFDVWFRKRGKELFNGLDLSEPLPGPLSEPAFNVLGR